jgi:hypothetical protein
MRVHSALSDVNDFHCLMLRIFLSSILAVTKRQVVAYNIASVVTLLKLSCTRFSCLLIC